MQPVIKASILDVLSIMLGISGIASTLLLGIIAWNSDKEFCKPTTISRPK